MLLRAEANAPPASSSLAASKRPSNGPQTKWRRQPNLYLTAFENTCTYAHADTIITDDESAAEPFRMFISAPVRRGGWFQA